MRFLLNVGARASVMFFWKIFMLSLFEVTTMPTKVNGHVWDSFSVVNIIQMVCNFVFFLHLNLVKNFIFFIKGTRKGTNMFNGPANLRKFHRRKPDKSYSKDPYVLCCKTLHNGYRTSPLVDLFIRR